MFIRNVLRKCLTFKHVSWIKECRNAEVCLSHAECKLIVPVHVVGVEIIEVNQIWSEVMNDGAEPEAVSPRGRHVDDVDLAFGDVLAPVLQVLRSL